MATGKTNSRWYRLVHGGVDLSGDARTVGSFGETYAETDVTGWSDGVINFTLGSPTCSIEGFQAVFNNTAVTGSHTLLSTLPDSYASMFIGIRAAPAVGDPAFSIPSQGNSYHVLGDAMIAYESKITQTGTLGVSGLFRGFGVALATGASLAATTNGTSVNNLASSANGALGYLHITASSGGTWAIKIQDSPDDAAWADLITFTANGSAITAEQGSATGTVDQYTRAVFTRTSGTLSAWMTLIRL